MTKKTCDRFLKKIFLKKLYKKYLGGELSGIQIFTLGFPQKTPTKPSRTSTQPISFILCKPAIFFLFFFFRTTSPSTFTFNGLIVIALALQHTAPFLLGEHLSSTEFGVTFLITGGATIVVVNASHATDSESLDVLIARFKNPEFIAYICFVFAVCMVLLSAFRRMEKRAQMNAQSQSQSQNSMSQISISFPLQSNPGSGGSSKYSRSELNFPRDLGRFFFHSSHRLNFFFFLKISEPIFDSNADVKYFIIVLFCFVSFE
jgi:uncharacterized membrane protein YidH (DUF202 family)